MPQASRSAVDRRETSGLFAAGKIERKGPASADAGLGGCGRFAEQKLPPLAEQGGERPFLRAVNAEEKASPSRPAGKTSGPEGEAFSLEIRLLGRGHGIHCRLAVFLPAVTPAWR